MGQHQHDTKRAATAAPGGTATEAPAALALQASAGNAAIAAMMAGAQAKLKVGRADDPAEREADRVAGEVMQAMRGGDPGGVAHLAAPTIQRKASGDAGAGTVSADTDAAIAHSRGGGTPLPDTTRTGMEEAFGGADFSGVRVHTDTDAASLNGAVGARAFTVGQDIFFGSGEYGGGRGSQELLAHELTHVVQQSSDTIQRKEIDPNSTVKLGTSVKRKTEHTEDGRTETTDRKAQAGVGTSGGTSSDVFDGTTRTTSATKTEGFAGAEAACKTISKYSPGEVEHAVELMARAGAFGEASAKAAVERGKLKASAEGKATGKAGAEATLKASVKVSEDLFNALKATVEAGAMVGVEGSLQGKLAAGYGPLSASISGQLKAMAGAMAKAKASLDVGITHVYAEFEASAFAGAKVDGEAKVGIKLGDAEATAAIQGSAMAGAEAKVEGGFKIDLSGVEMSGKVEAFAGVKATAKGKTEFGYGGRTIFSASGKVGVSAGVGGKAGGEFSFRAGKLKISGDVALALGIGGEVGAEIEVDFYALALMIEDLIVKAFLTKKEQIERASPGVERTPIIDEALAAKTRQQGYDAYIKDFQAYDAKKAKQGDSGIKRERVQEILDNRWHSNKQQWQFAEFDEGIMRAAREAFGNKLTDIIVQGGQLRAFQVTRTAEQQDHLKKQRQKAGLKF